MQFVGASYTFRLQVSFVHLLAFGCVLFVCLVCSFVGAWVSGLRKKMQRFSACPCSVHVRCRYIVDRVRQSKLFQQWVCYLRNSSVMGVFSRSFVKLCRVAGGSLIQASRRASCTEASFFEASNTQASFAQAFLNEAFFHRSPLHSSLFH